MSVLLVPRNRRRLTCFLMETTCSRHNNSLLLMSANALRYQLTALLLVRTNISQDVKKTERHDLQALTTHTGLAFQLRIYIGINIKISPTLLFASVHKKLQFSRTMVLKSSCYDKICTYSFSSVKDRSVSSVLIAARYFFTVNTYITMSKLSKCRK
jgi:hypothetical protein